MSNYSTVVQQFQPQVLAATVRSVPESELKRITSTFASDMQVTGDYKGKSSGAGLRVEGEYAGKIVFETGGCLHIAAGACVTSSQVEADYVVIEGHFNGTILARKLIEILPCAVVEGEIKYSDMDWHCGARVRGQLDTIQGSEDDKPSKSNITTLQSGQEVLSPSSSTSFNSAAISANPMQIIASLNSNRNPSGGMTAEAAS